jgi:hypothetical protein
MSEQVGVTTSDSSHLHIARRIANNDNVVVSFVGIAIKVSLKYVVLRYLRVLRMAINGQCGRR